MKEAPEECHHMYGGIRMRVQTWISSILLVLLMLPPVVTRLEATMTGQMLIQIPLLVVVGYGAGSILKRKIPSIQLYVGGIPGLLMIVFTMVFWMIPRSLDQALTMNAMEVAKYVTLTLFVGIPLGVGWRKLGFIARGFIWIHLLSMIFLMGWLYAASPIRVCNQYLIDQQQVTGWLLISAGIAIILYHIGISVVRTFSGGINEDH